jgi:hypothetical protein
MLRNEGVEIRMIREEITTGGILRGGMMSVSIVVEKVILL